MTLVNKYQSLADISEASRVKLLQVGISGSGKTFRAAHAARWGKVLFWDFDDKIESLKKTLSPELQKNILVRAFRMEFGKGSEVMETTAMEEFITELEAMEAKVAKGEPLDFATVVLDTWSTYELFYIPFLLGQNNSVVSKHGSRDTLRSRVDTGAGVIDVPNLTDFLALGKAHARLVRRITNLPVNVIFNLHEGEAENKITGQTETTLKTIGKFRLDLPTLFNDVHSLSTTDGKAYKARIRKNAKMGMLKTSLPSSVADVIDSADLSVFDEIAYKQKGDK